jgi:hypothetical protein
MAQKQDWLVQTAADEAALQLLLRGLRQDGNMPIHIIHNGTAYAVAHLVGVYDFAFTAVIESSTSDPTISVS